MSDAPAPTKRRRTKGGALTMKPKKASWPKDPMPVEIYTLIISHLPRSSIQNMRLVNKEFEEKVSEYLFRVVVVPFKPEIYGITPEPKLGGTSELGASDLLQGSILLQDKGMRVFQGFGRRILKFAMSFEIDETKLANPPPKCDQEAITSFWGIYRWPFKRYHRYHHLDGLEQTADETRTMAKALRFIESAKELGLSIDGGLGWLPGLDLNSRVHERGEKVAVFGKSRFVPEPKDSLGLGQSSKSRDSLSSEYSIIERMLVEAGYCEESLDASVRLMLETEETPSQATADLEVMSSPRHFMIRQPSTRSSAAGADDEDDEGEEDEGESIEAKRARADRVNALLDRVAASSGGMQASTAYSASRRPVLSSHRVKSNDGWTLKPNNLTNAQLEMLLEIEWAQRAFMQSYAIAVIDNPSTFKNIETLTIARLPSRHLPILRREDFWDSLTQLKKLSLAIIPDWRDVVKHAANWVEDIKLAPSQSVSGVYQLLQEQISNRKNITSLHFEWICGGEYSPGLFSRNQHILSAPIVPKSTDMLNRPQIPPLIRFPYVEHLSLKNCWFSPHILSRFVQTLKKGALQSLTMDSVSLTAALPNNAQPNPLTLNAAVNPQNAQNMAGQAAANNMLVNFQGMLAQNALNGQNVPLPLPAIAGNFAPNAATPDDVIEWLEIPRPGSWAAIIDKITPGITMADVRFARGLGAEPVPCASTRLRKIQFISCGYVRLPLDFDQTMLDPSDVHTPQVAAIAKRISDLDAQMMKPPDSTLGVVVNHIKAAEASTLENVWDMTINWGSSRAELTADAHLDGISLAGQGRFDGVINGLYSSS